MRSSSRFLRCMALGDRGDHGGACRVKGWYEGRMSRERSLWAWGWADRFPGDDARRALAQQVAGALGIPEPALRAPPVLASIRMPDSRALVPGELASIV